MSPALWKGFHKMNSKKDAQDSRESSVTTRILPVTTLNEKDLPAKAVDDFLDLLARLIAQRHYRTSAHIAQKEITVSRQQGKKKN